MLSLYLHIFQAMNGGGPTAQIIEREGWKTDKDFVGHRKAITCVVSKLSNFLIFFTHLKKNCEPLEF